MKTPETSFKTLLQRAGHKATPGRLKIMHLLSKEREPVTAAYLQKKLKGIIDRVTLYRSLHALVESGVVRGIDFRHHHTHYELNASREHHHHIVCTDCGRVEDTECDMQPITEKVARKSSHFRTIADHATEFFGICNTCTQ